MKSFLFILPLCFLCNTFLFSQPVILSDFDISSEGWSVSGGLLYYHSSEGNPGGFIEFEDDQDGRGVFIVPGNFLGDLRDYNLGSLNFDLKNTYDNGQDSLYGYGNVTISSSNFYVEKNVVPLGYISEWTSFSIPLTAGDWGLTESGWDSLLSDVTDIRIQMDAQWNYYDRSGLDNFSISPYSTGIDPSSFDNKLFGYQLNQNSPNPFNPITTIRFSLSKPGFTTLKVYDLLGKEVVTIVSERLNPGMHTITWNASNYPNGVYLYQLKSGEFIQTKKMVLMK